MNTNTKRPLPRDAVMIVAAQAGTARLELMESVHRATCRHCGCEVHVDGYTLRRAEQMEARRGRPIQFFCWPCHELYDVAMCDVTEDYSRRLEGAPRGCN